ncbi:MAG TPA: GntR family transcriptional regulator [Phytomonospora sp.]
MTDNGRPGALRDRVYETLRRRIIEATAPPGLRLVERDLAAELEVSRIPLREALRLLAADGLVVTVPGRGTIVSPFTPDDVRDLFDVRESLEALTARLAAERADTEGLGRLRVHLDRARSAMAAGDRAGVTEANADFHDELVAIAGNALLSSLARPLSGRLRRLFHLTADRDQAVQCAEHEELYAAIAAGDGLGAAAHAARHVASGREHSLAAAADWSRLDAESLTRTRRRGVRSTAEG